MKGVVTVAMASWTLALLAGCGGTANSQAKVEAYQRWHEARARVLLGVGEERFKAGDLDAAAANAQEALALAPDMVVAQVLLARVAIEKGRFDQAQQWLAQAAVLMPASAQIFHLSGVVQEKQGRLEQAMQSYQKARAMEPHNAAHVLACAEVLVAMNRPVEALELVESKLTSMDQALSIYRAAGELALLVQRYDRAAEHFAQARHLDAGDTGLLENQARALFFAGRHERALSVLRDLAGREEYDRRAWVHTMLGECHMAMSEHRSARACFERATQLEPAVARHWVNLAKAALALRDLSRAVLAAREARRLEPAGVESAVVLGYALLAQGQAGRAQDVLLEAVQARPDQPMLQCLLGRSYSALGEQARAVACYRATLTLEPDHRLARELLAQAGSP